MSEPPAKRHKPLDAPSGASHPEESTPHDVVSEDGIEAEDGDASKEVLCGITEILGKTRGFKAVTKKRCKQHRR